MTEPLPDVFLLVMTEPLPDAFLLGLHDGYFSHVGVGTGTPKGLWADTNPDPTTNDHGSGGSERVIHAAPTLQERRRPNTKGPRGRQKW